MITYCENVVFEAFLPNKENLLKLEKVILKKIPEPFAYIYNITASIQNIKVGPEVCMQDFVDHNGLFEAMEKVKDFQITIDYLDRFHQVHIRFSNNLINLSLKGADDNWVNEKLEQVRLFFDLNKTEDKSYEIEDYEDENLFIENPKWQQEYETQSRPATIMTIVAIISLLIAIISIGWYLYKLFYWQYTDY